MTDRLKIVERLRACAEDPMWENHVEVSKKLLIDAANALEKCIEPSEVNQLVERLAALDCAHKCGIGSEVAAIVRIEARQRIVGPSLSEITDRFRDANVPEVSGQVFARR